MLSILLGGLFNGVVGYFLARWCWRRGYRQGYETGTANFKVALNQSLERLLSKQETPHE